MTAPLQRSTPNIPLDLTLAAPLLCASAGVLLAAVVSSWSFPITVSWTPFNSHLLESHWQQFNPEPRESNFLALAAILGTLGAVFGAQRNLVPVRRTIVVAAGFALALALNMVLGYALTVSNSAALVSLAAALWIGGVAFTLFRFDRGVASIEALSMGPIGASPLAAGFAWREHVVPVAVLALLLLPSSLQSVAARIGYEMHVASFIIGPALFSRTPGLIPGIDYFTQYSVGLPYFFSFAIADTADATIIRYVALMIGAMFAYYLGLHYFLRWIFRSWKWAMAITIVALLLHFHTNRPFFDPSSYVLRHPLIILVMSMLAWWVSGGLRASRGVLLAVAVAVSAFVNTETGLYSFLTVAGIAFFAAPTRWRGISIVMVFAIAVSTIFMALCVAAFGWGAASIAFVQRLIEPLLIYRGGYGSWTVDWSYGWNTYYNVVAPGLALGTIGWGLVNLSRARGDELRARLAALTALGCFGIMLTAKYWNMSIVGLWHVNALPFLALTAWWTRELAAAVPGRSSATIAEAALGVMAFWLVVFAGDQRNPSDYGLRAYLKYPSAWSAPFGKRNACRRLECAAPRLAPEDVQLISSLTLRGDRVAVFDWNDWAYLIEAGRASKFQVTPGLATFLNRQINALLTELDIVFVAMGTDGHYVVSPPELRKRLLPALEREFVVAGRGSHLVALKRRGSR